MKKSKSIICMLLVFSLAFANNFTIFAAQKSAIQTFVDAMQTTGKTLSKEQTELKKIYDADEENNMLIKLLTQAYQMDMNFSLPLDLFQYKDLTFDFSSLMKSDIVNSKFMNKLMLSLSNKKDKVALNLDYFFGKDEISFSVPELFEGYLSVKGEDLEDYAELINYISYMQNSNSKALKYTDKDILKMFDKYQSILANALFNMNPNDYTFADAATLKTSYGEVACNAVTLRISKESANAIAQQISNTIRSDEDLKAFYADLLGVLFDDYYTVDDLMEDLADSVEYIEFYDDIYYTIYINSDGVIVKHSFTDEEAETTFYIETIGKDYLLDEIVMGFENDGYYEKVGLELSAVGNTIPVNGVSAAKINLVLHYGEGKSRDIFGMDVAYDSKLAEDNVTYSLMFNSNLDTYEEDEPVDKTEADYEAGYAEYLKEFNDSIAEIKNMTPEQKAEEYANYLHDIEAQKEEVKTEYDNDYLPNYEENRVYYEEDYGIEYPMLTFDEYYKEYYSYYHYIPTDVDDYFDYYYYYDGWDEPESYEDYVYYDYSYRYNYYNFKMNMQGKGTYKTDVENSTFGMNFTENTVNVNGMTIPFTFSFNLSPIAVGSITAPADAKQISKLSDDEMEALSDKVYTNLMTIYAKFGGLLSAAQK